MMKQRIWWAIFALIFVASCVKNTHETRDREPITIELLPDGFSIDGKEIRFGMTMDEVRAILGKPRPFFSGDRTFAYHDYTLGFTDDMGVLYVSSLLLDRDNPHTTLLIDAYAFRYHGDYTLVSEQLAEIAHRHEGKVWEEGIIFIHNYHVLIDPDEGSLDQIDTIFVSSRQMQPRAIAIELLSDGLRIDEKELRFGMSEAEVIALLGEPMHIFDDAGKPVSYGYAEPPVSLNFDRQLGEEFVLGSLRLLAPPRRGVTFLLLGEEFSLKDDWQAIQARLKAIDDPAFYLDTKAPLWFTASWHDVTLTLPSSDVIMMQYRWQE